MKHSTLRLSVVVLFSFAFSFFMADLGWSAELPKNLKWETNDSDPEFSDPSAQKGGTLNLAMSTYPLTFRTVGPDANSVLYLTIVDNQMSLVTLHPNTERAFSLIATHWYVAPDERTVYYKLNPKAVWSDGKPITADDFVFTLEFMQSKHLVAPWYNEYYKDSFEAVEKIDDHTLMVRLRNKKPRLLYYADLPPTPRHFYGSKVDPDFVKKFNWTIVPNAGPYQISRVDKGKSVTFARKKDWWGKDQRFLRYRFNPDKITYWVVRESAVEFEWFKAGKLDSYVMSDPTYWEEKSKEKVFQDGYVERFWFYNDSPRPTAGFWLNMKSGQFKDRNLRLALAHSMNFEKLLSTVLRNEYVRLNTIADGYGDYVADDIKALPFDLKKADSYYKLAGWDKRGPDGIRVKDGDRLSYSVMYSSDIWTPRLVLLREEAKKAGLELNMKRMDWAAVLKAESAKNYDMVLMGSVGFMFPQYWDTWNSKSDSNITATSIPELDKLTEDYRSESSEAKKKSISKKIQKLVHEHAAFIPGVATEWAPRLGIWRWWRFPKVLGTKISQEIDSPTNLQYGGLFWFDQKRYDETQAAMKASKKFPPVVTVDKTYIKSKKKGS